MVVALQALVTLQFIASNLKGAPLRKTMDLTNSHILSEHIQQSYQRSAYVPTDSRFLKGTHIIVVACDLLNCFHYLCMVELGPKASLHTFWLWAIPLTNTASTLEPPESTRSESRTPGLNVSGRLLTAVDTQNLIRHLLQHTRTLEYKTASLQVQGVHSQTQPAQTWVICLGNQFAGTKMAGS